MDNSLNNNALNMITFAPIFLLMNGFWFVDNKAIFENVWFYKMRFTDNMKSGHFLEGFHVTHSTPLFIFVIYAWVLKILVAVISE